MRFVMRTAALAVSIIVTAWALPGCSSNETAGGKMEGGAADTGKMEGGATSGKMVGGTMEPGKMEGGAMEPGKMDGAMDKGKMEPPPR